MRRGADRAGRLPEQAAVFLRHGTEQGADRLTDLFGAVRDCRKPARLGPGTACGQVVARIYETARGRAAAVPQAEAEVRAPLRQLPCGCR
ncbi:hypothetical protein [Kitasatospora griseola]|uniref:hypothetical protein n=1 Tax=Kitasatospora griseola TaxID=2064 RepID=UPI001670E946|nr:hypothetical protein [Kitasatospora griseola]GGQ54282.1 hypothetical protein GCM10010195_07170 [Kitasatospora griseola]